MDLLLQAFQSDAHFTDVALMMAVLTVLTTIVFAVLAARGKRVPAVVWLLLPVATAASGSWIAVDRHVHDAQLLASTTPAAIDMLAFETHASALLPEVAGLFMGSLLMVFVALAAAIGHALNPGEQVLRTTRTALGGAIIVGAGALGTLLYGLVIGAQGVAWLPVVTLVLAGIALPIVGFRTAEDRHSPDARRMAAACGFVVLGLGLALLMMTSAAVRLGEWQTWSSFAMGDPSGAGLIASSQALSLGVPATILVLFAGLAVAGPTSEQVGVRRVLVGSAQVVPLLAIAGFVCWQSVSTSLDCVTATGPKQLPKVLTQTSALPDVGVPEEMSQPELGPPFGRNFVVWKDGEWLRYMPDEDLRPATLPAAEGEWPAVVASPSVPAVRFADTNWGQGFQVIALRPMPVTTWVDQYRALRGVRISWLPEGVELADDDLGLVEDRGWPMLQRAGGEPTEIGLGLGSLRELAAAVDTGSVTRLVVVPQRQWSLQDLVTYCLVAQSTDAHGYEGCAVTAGLAEPQPGDIEGEVAAAR